VAVGHGLVNALADYLPYDAERLLLIYPPVLRRDILAVVDSLRAGGREVHLLQTPDSEASKCLGVVEEAWRLLGEARLTRTDAIVAIGGGATTDVGGFIAATWLRGVPLVNVPTTLLAMVDAAIGGKTGINTAQGKNLVGAFHVAHAVVVDLDWLTRLDPMAMASGLGEIIKCGFVADPRILDVVWSAPREVRNPTSDCLREVISRAIAVKADVVERDPFEQSVRTILNYGHTFGHAIEKVEGYTWPHGHAVAVGMVFAAEVGARAGLMDPSLRGAHREILGSVGLPTFYRPGLWEELSAAMRVDKKNRGSRRRMVVLEEIGTPIAIENPDPSLLRSAYEAISVPLETAS
jgi:3-dehydroquinate synthase